MKDRSIEGLHSNNSLLHPRASRCILLRKFPYIFDASQTCNRLPEDADASLFLLDPCMQFGEIDIDSELVASVQRLDGKEEQRIMMLNNGCLCCTVREDLVGMLNELVRLAPLIRCRCDRPRPAQ